VLRSPLALRASSRGHPSEFSCRLSDNPFVRFCFPIKLQLAPSLNRSASRSSQSPACTADRASRSAVLSVDWLAPLESNLPASSSARVVSLHRRPSFRFCCPAGSLDSRLATGLRASPSIAPSACAFGWISGSASRLLSGLRLLPTVPPHLPRCSSACAASCASGSAFLPRHLACAAWSGLSASPSAPLIGLRPQLSFRPLPSCLCRFDLRLAAGLPALPSYLTADFPAAFLLRRCPQVPRWLSPLIPLLAHPSDSNFRRCRLSPLRSLRLIKSRLSPWPIFRHSLRTFQYSKLRGHQLQRTVGATHLCMQVQIL
jgi:hypothetical protein